jgi:hypothetical protein
VVERTQQQHHVGAVVGLGKRARISQACAAERMAGLARGGLERLGHVQRDRIDQMDSVSTRGQPAGVGAWATTHVEDDRGGCGQPGGEDRLRAHEL